MPYKPFENNGFNPFMKIKNRKRELMLKGHAF